MLPFIVKISLRVIYKVLKMFQDDKNLENI